MEEEPMNPVYRTAALRHQESDAAVLMKAFGLGCYRARNSYLETSASLAAVCSVSGFLLKPLHICFCAKAKANKLKKEGETWINSVEKSNVNI